MKRDPPNGLLGRTNLAGNGRVGFSPRDTPMSL